MALPTWVLGTTKDMATAMEESVKLGTGGANATSGALKVPVMGPTSVGLPLSLVAGVQGGASGVAKGAGARKAPIRQATKKPSKGRVTTGVPTVLATFLAVLALPRAAGACIAFRLLVEVRVGPMAAAKGGAAAPAVSLPSVLTREVPTTKVRTTVATPRRITPATIGPSTARPMAERMATPCDAILLVVRATKASPEAIKVPAVPVEAEWPTVVITHAAVLGAPIPPTALASLSKPTTGPTTTPAVPITVGGRGTTTAPSAVVAAPVLTAPSLRAIPASACRTKTALQGEVGREEGEVVSLRPNPLLPRTQLTNVAEVPTTGVVKPGHQ